MMEEETEHPDLKSRDFPINEDMGYQIKLWRFERVGWYVLVVVMLLGLAGLFSRGALSSRDIISADGRIRAEYELFHRNGSTNAMTFSLTGEPMSAMEVELSGELFDGFSVETLQPEPLRSSSSADGIRIWVQTDKKGRANVFMTLRGEGLGLFRSNIALLSGSNMQLTQFIFP
ncbi:hypothetical protein [Pseudomonas protegens]|uniref:hypothetical protein n=1 Tax=Pseudomonas protegens TaxID=380021 RepID=UPI000AB450EF|nr:hypothetical protein [Pseudomonas protegens]